jgi:fluoroquinolone resistance protein
MERTYIQDKQFKKQDYTATPLVVAEYENCRFVNCNFAESSLAKITFTQCEFSGCNLGLAKLTGTGFREVVFNNNCKLLGLHFHHCNAFLFSVKFYDCTLNLSSFYNYKIQNTRFNNCSLKEVDFTEADCTGAVFTHCNFEGALFDNTILHKADFSTAYNYSIDVENNRIKKAIFSIPGLAGLLNKYDIVIK